jgi:alpha-L-fucosidase
VREFVDACRVEGLKPGLYLSPWDRHEPRYGDSERYNDFYCDQLTELLTRYGRIHEVWFDGANGEGPNGKRQVYDWPRTWALVKKHQPNAVIFSDAGPDVRWIGNERGVAGDTNWSTVDPEVVKVPGAGGRAVTAMLQRGDPAGTVWRPGETDVSIRPGWFHHPAEDARVKTVDQLISIFFTSVGRNSKLLLNVPPTRDGIIHRTDAERLLGMRGQLTAIFREDLAARRRVTWRTTGPASGVAEIDPRPASIATADLGEDITRADRRRYARRTRHGDWQLGHWTTIGIASSIASPRPCVRRRLTKRSNAEAVKTRAGDVTRQRNGAVDAPVLKTVRRRNHSIETSVRNVRSESRPLHAIFRHHVPQQNHAAALTDGGGVSEYPHHRPQRSRRQRRRRRSASVPARRNPGRAQSGSPSSPGCQSRGWPGL